jgi:hypothetical protein
VSVCLLLFLGGDALPLSSGFDDVKFYAERVCSTFLTVKPFSLVCFLLIFLSTNHTATVASYVMAIFFLHVSSTWAWWPLSLIRDHVG